MVYNPCSANLPRLLNKKVADLAADLDHKHPLAYGVTCTTFLYFTKKGVNKEPIIAMAIHKTIVIKTLLKGDKNKP